MAKDSKKLDDVEINKLKAVIGMEKVTSTKEDDVEKLREFLESEQGVASSESMQKGTDEKKGAKTVEEKAEEKQTQDKAEQQAGGKAEESGKESDLFVKIDNHREIALKLLEARKEIKSIADTIELLAKAESLKEEAIRRMEEHVGKMESLWKSVLNYLAEGDKIYPEYFDEKKVVESELANLKAELDRLGELLGRMK